MGRGDLAQGARDALARSCGVCHLRLAAKIREDGHTGKMRRWKTSNTGRSAALEPPPWSRPGFAVVVAAIVAVARASAPGRALPRGVSRRGGDRLVRRLRGKRRLRVRLAATGIESRRLRTRFIPWTQIRDVKVVNRVTVARPGRQGESQPPHQQVGRRRPQAVVGSGAAGQWPLAGTGHAGGVGERARSGIHGQGECDQRPLAGRQSARRRPSDRGVTRARAASPSAAARARRGCRRCLTGCRPARRCPAWGR